MLARAVLRSPDDRVAKDPRLGVRAPKLNPREERTNDGDRRQSTSERGLDARNTRLARKLHQQAADTDHRELDPPTRVRDGQNPILLCIVFNRRVRGPLGRRNFGSEKGGDDWQDDPRLLSQLL